MKRVHKTFTFFTFLLLQVIAFTIWLPQRITAETLACNSQGITISGADANWCFSTATPSSVFNSLLALVSPRVAHDYARSNLLVSLTDVPPAMQSALANVAVRVGFDYARANRDERLHFPVDLVNDTTAPNLVGEISETPSGDTNAVIRWTTNEYATSQVKYGTQSGSYTQTISDGLYVKTHTVELTGLTDGETYYYTVVSQDKSGNTYASGEQNFTLESQSYIYLPVVVR